MNGIISMNTPIDMRKNEKFESESQSGMKDPLRVADLQYPLVQCTRAEEGNSFIMR